MQEIADGVFAETGYYGCNVSCIRTDEGVALVDTPQRPSDAVDWRKRVEALGPIRYQVNTEHHPDHIMGNWFFRDAVFVAHEGTRARFGERGNAPEKWREHIAVADPEGLALMEGYDFRLPDIGFREHLTLYLGGREIVLLHRRGHTENQAMVYVADAKALLPGDNVVENWPPFFHSAIPGEWLACLESIERMDVEVITPGHGAVCDKGALEPLRSSIREMVNEVQRAIDAGQTREEVQELKTYVLRWDAVRQAAPDFYVNLATVGLGRLYDLLK